MSIQEESTKDRLDEVLELVRENNRILRMMHRRMVWSQVFTFVYWLIILGVAGWSYYYFQPYVVKYMDTFQSVVKTLDTLEQESKNFPGEIGGLLEKMR